MPGADQGMPMSFFSFMPIMMLIFGVLIIVPFWVIFSKAGHSKWLSLLMIVPLVNVIAIYYLAFSEWPSLAKANER
ncbi:MAG: hypothetical protein J0G95_06710 [Rhizobiales bacterium]|nr:hypothetical protein [Hyphomicrobiales bacterium]